jgi:hypothetical protein
MSVLKATNDSGVAQVVFQAFHRRWADTFGSFERCAHALVKILEISRSVEPPDHLGTFNGDIIISCDLCADTPENNAWWQNNFGPLWEAARWYYCGIFGLNCPPAPAA